MSKTTLVTYHEKNKIILIFSKAADIKWPFLLSWATQFPFWTKIELSAMSDVCYYKSSFTNDVDFDGCLKIIGEQLTQAGFSWNVIDTIENGIVINLVRWKHDIQ